MVRYGGQYIVVKSFKKKTFKTKHALNRHLPW